MILLLVPGVAGDLCVEDEKAGLERFEVRADALAVRLEQEAAFARRRRPVFA